MNTSRLRIGIPTYAGGLFFILLAVVMLTPTNTQAQKKFKKNWSSLNKVNSAPDWFQDAKFGIYAHWGPVSSAFVGADPDKHYAGWHGMKMYDNGKLDPNKSGKPTNNHIHLAVLRARHAVDRTKTTAR